VGDWEGIGTASRTVNSQSILVDCLPDLLSEFEPEAGRIAMDRARDISD
jgi:hypothetical protein